MWRRWVPKKRQGIESEDPGGINGVTRGIYRMHLARAVKETQKDEKHAPTIVVAWDTLSSECPLVKTSRYTAHLNQKEGTAMKKGAQTPQFKMAKPKVPQEGIH